MPSNTCELKNVMLIEHDGLSTPGQLWEINTLLFPLESGCSKESERQNYFHLALSSWLAQTWRGSWHESTPRLVRLGVGNFRRNVQASVVKKGWCVPLWGRTKLISFTVNQIGSALNVAHSHLTRRLCPKRMQQSVRDRSIYHFAWHLIGFKLVHNITIWRNVVCRFSSVVLRSKDVI